METSKDESKRPKFHLALFEVQAETYPDRIFEEERLRRFRRRTDDLIGAKNITPGHSIGVDVMLLIPIISFNAAGFKTQWSCAGNHVDQLNMAYLLFEPGVKLPKPLIDFFVSIGLNVNEEMPDMRDGSGLLRTRIGASVGRRGFLATPPEVIIEKNAEFLSALDFVSRRVIF